MNDTRTKAEIVSHLQKNGYEVSDHQILRYILIGTGMFDSLSEVNRVHIKAGAYVAGDFIDWMNIVKKPEVDERPVIIRTNQGATLRTEMWRLISIVESYGYDVKRKKNK